MPTSSALPDLDRECFFIAPIGQDGSPERKRSDGVLEFIVSRAAQEVSLTAVRADQLAEPGQITLQVIEHVLGARGAVVDLTGLNPNVFYELAIRHTARLPVVLIAEKGCALPFDIAQMRTIFFDHTDLASADACRREIAAHLREALDNGAVDSPIATTIDVQTMQSGSIVERNIAELVTSVEELSKGQRSLSSEIGRLLRRDATVRFAPAAIDDLESVYVRLQDLAHRIDDEELRTLVKTMAEPVHYISRRGRITDLERRSASQRTIDRLQGATDRAASDSADDAVLA